MSLILDAIDGATRANDLRGARGFHALNGDRSGVFAMSVSGNWQLTSRFGNRESANPSKQRQGLASLLSTQLATKTEAQA